MSWRRTSAAPAAFLSATVLLVAGCQFLTGGISPDDLAEPSPLATYSSGSATITLGDGTKVALAELHGKGSLFPLGGAAVSWESDDGWYLQFSGSSGGGGGFGSASYLTIDRISGHEHWTTRDPNRCIVDVTKADATGVTGSATCKGLQWHDAMSYAIPIPLESGGGVAGQKAFDATVTFEAKP